MSTRSLILRRLFAGLPAVAALLIASGGSRVSATQSDVGGEPVENETLLISRAGGPDGAQGDGQSALPSTSSDGRYVAFMSWATTLHPDDTDDSADVFLRDVLPHETILVSRAGGEEGAKGNGESGGAAISADGRYVAFVSFATNLHPDDTDGTVDVFVRDLQTNETILVSRSDGPDGEKGNGSSTQPAISADGRHVAFISQATNLHPDKTDGVWDVFVRDMSTHETILVTRASGAEGVKGNFDSTQPAISGDGRYVAYESFATNLHPDDPDILTDTFLRDVQADETILISRATGADGAKGNNESGFPSLSADGRYVAFDSFASNLHPEDSDPIRDVFVRDTQTNETVLVSRASGAAGAKGNHSSGFPAISADGRLIAFMSQATNLDPDDTDELNDVFLRDTHTNETALVSRASGPDGTDGDLDSFNPWVSGDGRYVSFDSFATNLYPDDTNETLDVFLRDVEGMPMEPTLTFDPSDLDFGEVEVGSTGTTLLTSLANAGSGAATGVTFGPTDGGFEVDSSACSDTLPSGTTCSVSVTFTPVEPGPITTTLDVTSDQDASASLGLAGTGTSGETIAPVGLQVDMHGLLSDGNQVFEPGELVEVAPAWHNNGLFSESLTGTASGFGGTEGANYLLPLDHADYGSVEPADTASCLETGICYWMGVSDLSARPATLWEATFDETLSDGTAHTWNLHIGDSFLDVPRSSPFYAAVETLLHHGVTGGCGDAHYCPAGANTRGQMAVFLLRAAEDEDYVPSACTEGEERFADVPFDHPLCPWIEELAERGVTAGCSGDDYCPGNPVSRAQMAVFLLKAFEGGGYAPQECSGVFSDVACPSTFAAWIEELAAREITGGCSASEYCPAAPVTRAQMAVFVSETFGLTLYGP